ncbi:hypothetical protein BJ165DRAFT_1447047, partial [Panaeolus papilionaceus]
MLQPITSTIPLSGYDHQMGITLAEYALNLGVDAVPSFQELVKRATIINTLERLPETDEQRLQREYEELLRVYQAISIASTSNESYPSEARSNLMKELGAMMQPFLHRHQARKTLHAGSTKSSSLPDTSMASESTPKSGNVDLWLLPEVDPSKPPSRDQYTVVTNSITEKQSVPQQVQSTTKTTKKRTSWYLSGMTNVADYFKVGRRSPPVTL